MTQGLGILTGRFGRIALLDMDTSLTVHAHGHCHIVLKVAGPDQEFTVEGTAVPLQADTAVLVNSWQEHSYAHRLNGERSVFLALYLETDWLGEADRIFSACGRPAFFRDSCVHLSPEAEIWRKRLVEMIEESSADGSAVEEAILQLTHSVRQRAANGDSRPVRAADNRVRRAVRYMHESKCEPFNFEKVASVAGLSRSRLNTLFRESIGVTPAVYGNAVRVEASIVALAQPENSISQVADDLGFSAASNFCRFFQQHTGVVPSNYRRAMAAVDF